MCGIVGARHDWLLQQGLDPAAAMRDAVQSLAWRGPDGQGVERAGAWWLGCARLAIGPARSRQPVVRRGGRFVGVMNGAIINDGDLLARLWPRWSRHRPRRAPPNDAWLPLLAVQRHDAAALREMRGHHAYAVVDLETGEVVLGQDRFGEKPLFCLDGRVSRGRELHAFASTPDALRHLGMPVLARPRRLGEWFRFGFADPAPHRFDVRLRLGSVPSRGEPLVLATGPRTWCQPWSPAVAAIPPSPRAPQPANLRAAAIDSVARSTDTTVPAALLLSGGIDSSCLAASLRALGRVLPAYQFRAEGAPGAEREVARAVAAHSGLPFRPVDAGPEVLDALPRLTGLAGLPLGDPSVLAVHAVARAAAADGIRVALGGEGADELFLGYRRYRALAHLPRLPWLRAAGPKWSMSYVARWLRAVTSGDPAGELLAVTPPAFGDTVLDPALAARRCWRGFPRTAKEAGGDAVMLARDADHDGYLRCDLLPKVDVATMAAGVEARCPWLEGDFAAHGAGRCHLGKAALRAAFEADLPAEVFRLPKHGFALPLDRWFRCPLPLLDLLAEPRSRQRPHLRPGGLAAAIDRHRSGRADLGHGLYLLLAYELFLRCATEDSATPAARTSTGA
jgi:asparagine synthase (glutamine-hydrolysing)